MTKLTFEDEIKAELKDIKFKFHESDIVYYVDSCILRKGTIESVSVEICPHGYPRINSTYRIKPLKEKYEDEFSLVKEQDILKSTPQIDAEYVLVINEEIEYNKEIEKHKEYLNKFKKKYEKILKDAIMWVQ
jgi:hypothetical protein